MLTDHNQVILSLFHSFVPRRKGSGGVWYLSVTLPIVPVCTSGKLDESMLSISAGGTKQSVKVYYRQALGMIRLSKHRPDPGPVHSHLTDSIKRLVGGRKNKKCSAWFNTELGRRAVRRGQQVKFILLYKTGEKYLHHCCTSTFVS